MHASDDLSLEQLEAIDRVCAQFKNAWAADPRTTTIAPFLDRVAPELRGHLEKRLRAVLDELLLTTPFQGKPTPPGPAGQAFEPGGESASPRIGPYKLVDRVGKGGMGEVWVAHQVEGVRRTVAIKFIRLGLDSRQFLARFEHERQALALMDHPNIAKVFDAGTYRPIDSVLGAQAAAEGPGIPYFVMEHVKGVPITDYCDKAQLTPQQRLELFIPVCQAVQHAHQKGIVHRDLKPSNVLVGLYDSKPIPKVIDFGLAKALHHKLIERSIHTDIGAAVGTLLYMAPEQAGTDNLDVDTRADIYSLGVMLYELLTGSPPFSDKDLHAVGRDKIVQHIKEVEPKRPSSRISGSAELPSIAAKRKLEPRRLAQLVAGDLDWIVMKCLEKERSRRYETANQLGEELRRYLADEPVQAGPPSIAYRTRKFLRRNRGPVVAVALLFATLVLGIIGTSIGFVQAELAAAAEKEVHGELETANEQTKAANVDGQSAMR